MSCSASPLFISGTSLLRYCIDCLGMVVNEIMPYSLTGIMLVLKSIRTVGS